MRLFLAVLLAALAGPAPAAPFVWKLETPRATHHFIGSVHLLPESAHPLPAAMDRAFEASRVLVFESDIGGMDDPQVQMRMLEHARSEHGLQAEAGDALYRRAQKRLVRMGLPEMFCDAFRAWFCSMTLEVISFQREGFRPDLGIDRQLYNRARDGARELRWLEPLDQHLGLFTGMSRAHSVEFLGATLDELEQGEASPQKLLEIWRNNDLAALDRIVSEMKREHPPAYERLLAARNRAWMGPLTTMLNGSTPVLVVVGAAHYAGPDGLPALLRARGHGLVPLED